MTITLNSVVSINPDILTSDIDNEVVMMNIDHGLYYGLDGVSKYIWDQLAEPQTVDALCTHLQSVYVVDRPTVEHEVLTFLNQLRSADLLTINEST